MTCGYTSDSLSMCGSIELNVPRAGRCALESLWASFLGCETPEGCGCPRPPGQGVAECGGSAQKQVFVEEEPAVLVLVVKRYFQERGLNGKLRDCKSRCAVAFPERLRCMRTGEYQCVGFVLHHGSRPTSGHYTARVLQNEMPLQAGSVSLYGTVDDKVCALGQQ